MGSLIRPTYTIPLPAGAKIFGDLISWTSGGKTKTGTLSGPGRNWTAGSSVAWKDA